MTCRRLKPCGRSLTLIKFKSARFKYGERGATKSTCLYLSPQVKERIDELSGLSRSAWVERWLEFAVAVQEEDYNAARRWAEWAESQLSERDAVCLSGMLNTISLKLDRWRDGP